MHLTGFEPVSFNKKMDYEPSAFDRSATDAEKWSLWDLNPRPLLETMSNPKSPKFLSKILLAYRQQDFTI
jgi:hypothetical protein